MKAARETRSGGRFAARVTVGMGARWCGFLGMLLLLPAQAQVGPCAVIAAPDGQTLYVACADATCVHKVSLAGRTVVGTIALSSPPSGLALSPDGTRLYVTCAGPPSVVEVIESGLESARGLAQSKTRREAGRFAESPDAAALSGSLASGVNDGGEHQFAATVGRSIGKVRIGHTAMAPVVSPEGGTLNVYNRFRRRAASSLSGRSRRRTAFGFPSWLTDS